MDHLIRISCRILYINYKATGGSERMKDLSAEQRQTQRQLILKPVVEEFFEWLESFYAMKWKLQTTVMYALNQKVELLRFLEDETLEASNNLAK